MDAKLEGLVADRCFAARERKSDPILGALDEAANRSVSATASYSTVELFAEPMRIIS